MTFRAGADQVRQPGGGPVDGLPVIFRAGPAKIENVAAKHEIFAPLPRQKSSRPNTSRPSSGSQTDADRRQKNIYPCLPHSIPAAHRVCRFVAAGRYRISSSLIVDYSFVAHTPHAVRLLQYGYSPPAAQWLFFPAVDRLLFFSNGRRWALNFLGRLGSLNIDYQGQLEIGRPVISRHVRRARLRWERFPSPALRKQVFPAAPGDFLPTVLCRPLPVGLSRSPPCPLQTEAIRNAF